LSNQITTLNLSGAVSKKMKTANKNRLKLVGMIPVYLVALVVVIVWLIGLALYSYYKAMRSGKTFMHEYNKLKDDNKTLF
jgi:type VI protein secretion system component VasF